MFRTRFRLGPFEEVVGHLAVFAPPKRVGGSPQGHLLASLFIESVHVATILAELNGREKIIVADKPLDGVSLVRVDSEDASLPLERAGEAFDRLERLEEMVRTVGFTIVDGSNIAEFKCTIAGCTVETVRVRRLQVPGYGEYVKITLLIDPEEFIGSVVTRKPANGWLLYASFYSDGAMTLMNIYSPKSMIVLNPRYKTGFEISVEEVKYIRMPDILQDHESAVRSVLESDAPLKPVAHFLVKTATLPPSQPAYREGLVM